MNQIANTRQKVLTAFQNVPMPKARDIILQPSSGDLITKRAMQKELANKSWNALSFDFLQSKSFGFMYLSPEAYHYYLPALLIAALDHFETSHFFHSVLVDLVPGSDAIYYHGKDSDFNLQTSLFGREEFCAMAAFFKCCLNNIVPRYNMFTAAQAMRWGNRYECAESHDFRTFDLRMRHFEYPELSELHGATLVDEIRIAFADVPYPVDNNLCGSEQGEEPATCALEFLGVDWRHVHPELLAYNYTSLDFLTREGFRYFLPAYLIADISGLAEESNADPVFSLTHGFTKPTVFDLGQTDYAAARELLREFVNAEEAMEVIQKNSGHSIDWHAYGVERMAEFTVKERQAIIHYLEYKAERDKYNALEMIQAIELYWKPSMLQVKH